MTPIQKIQIFMNAVSDYFLTTIGGDLNHLLFKKSAYLLEGVLFCILTYLWLEYAQMGKLYHRLFPIIFSSAIICLHYLFTKLICRFWKGLTITIGMFWGISFAGICLSFIVVNFLGLCGILCMIIGSYCPTDWHTSAPKGVVVFLEIVLMPWAVSTFLLVQRILKKQIEKELDSIKQINDSLQQRKATKASESDLISNKERTPDDKRQKSSGNFSTRLANGLKTIDFDDIYFVAVEDHYCRLAYNHQGELRSVLVRLSLMEALGDLPSDRFARIHRSYVVNLKHVKKIKKEGQAYQLFIEDIDKILPASRHRANVFLPKLKELLV